MLSPLEQQKKKLWVFRFEKVALSFAARPRLYTFVFEDLKVAEQWHRVMLGECESPSGRTFEQTRLTSTHA